MDSEVGALNTFGLTSADFGDRNPGHERFHRRPLPRAARRIRRPGSQRPGPAHERTGRRNRKQRHAEATQGRGKSRVGQGSRGLPQAAAHGRLNAGQDPTAAISHGRLASRQRASRHSLSVPEAGLGPQGMVVKGATGDTA